MSQSQLNLKQRLLSNEQSKFLKKMAPVSIFFAGLCCFGPLVLVLLGISTVSYAASLADVFYGQYKWVFRSIGLLSFVVALVWYFYTKEKVCTLDAVVRKRNQILNVFLIGLLIVVIGYIIWLYVIVHYLGVWLTLW
jgi:uncharacterized membrane protein